MSEPAPATRRGHRLIEELTHYAGLSLYLYVCFGAVLLYKAAVMDAEGHAYAPYGLAAVKALILGKFVMVAEVLRIGRRGVERLPLVVRLAHGSLMLLIVLVLLSLVEEIVAGLGHGRSVGASIGEFAGGSLFEAIATCLLMWLVLVPYLAFRMVRTALGPVAWNRLLFGRPG